MKVKILGTEYEVIKDAEEKDYPQLKKCDGFTDFSIKCIDSIGVDVNIFDRQSNDPIKDPINSPKVKVAKVSIKDNTEIINEIGKAINKIPIEINLNNLAKGGIIGGDG